MLRFKPTLLMVFATLSVALSAFAADSQLSLTQGFVRAMPAQVPNTAAYFTLSNLEAQPRTLIKVTSDIAKEAQLHTVIEEDGLVKMRQIDELIIPAQGELQLQPQAEHIMLLGLTQPTELEQLVQLTLHFKNGEQKQIKLPVQKAPTQMAEKAHHHHHH